MLEAFFLHFFVIILFQLHRKLYSNELRLNYSNNSLKDYDQELN